MTLPPVPKADLRRTSLARRQTLCAHLPWAADQVATGVRALLAPLLPKTVAGYMTLGDELDCRPTLALLDTVATLALPVTGTHGDDLSFRAWRPGAPLEKGPFGTLHPTSDAPIVMPDILLVPLVAFDRRGHRLGYGAGFYDRTLEGLRAHRPTLAIGLAYDGQEVPEIPTDATDQPLDAVVTDTRVLQFTQPFPIKR